jgi:hypothetical protein
MLEIELAFQHQCPYSDLSRKFPSTRILLWDNFQKEFLDVRSNNRGDWPKLNRELEALARTKGSKVLRKTSDGKSYQFMIMTCNCERTDSTLDMIMASDCLFVPPIRIHNGHETYHAIAFDRGGAKRMLDEVQFKGAGGNLEPHRNKHRVLGKGIVRSAGGPALWHDPDAGQGPRHIDGAGVLPPTEADFHREDRGFTEGSEDDLSGASEEGRDQADGCTGSVCPNVRQALDVGKLAPASLNLRTAG